MSICRSFYSQLADTMRTDETSMRWLPDMAELLAELLLLLPVADEVLLLPGAVLLPGALLVLLLPGALLVLPGALLELEPDIEDEASVPVTSTF